MKKFIMFSALAWLLGLSHAAANEIIINDITVPQGGEADLVVGYNFATDAKKIGATFILINLPEESTRLASMSMVMLPTKRASALER